MAGYKVTNEQNPQPPGYERKLPLLSYQSLAKPSSAWFCFPPQFSFLQSLDSLLLASGPLQVPLSAWNAQPLAPASFSTLHSSGSAPPRPSQTPAAVSRWVVRLKETARPCLVPRVSPASPPGPGTQSVPIIRTNVSRLPRESAEGQEVKEDAQGAGSDIPRGEGSRSREEENRGLSGPRQRRLCRDAAGRGAKELHASLPEGGRQKPSQRRASRPRAAQLCHYPADTE